MRISHFLLIGMAVICLSFTISPPAHAGTPPPTPSAVSSSDAHAALQRVLSRGEFKNYLQPKIKKPESRLSKILNSVAESIKGFFRKINEFFKRIFPQRKSSAERNAGVSTTWRYILYIIVAAAVVFLLGLMVSRIWSVRRLRMTSDDPDQVVEDEATRKKNEPSVWERSLLQAEAQWADGNQREAIRILQRACLVLLDARGVLRFQVSRANGEVLRELRRQGKTSAQQALLPIVGSFDRSWYGFLHLSSEEFFEALESSRHFRKAVTEERNA